MGLFYYQMKISYVHYWWLRIYSTQSLSLSNTVTTCLLLARNFLFLKFPLIWMAHFIWIMLISSLPLPSRDFCSWDFLGFCVSFHKQVKGVDNSGAWDEAHFCTCLATWLPVKFSENFCDEKEHRVSSTKPYSFSLCCGDQAGHTAQWQ